ncbi:MAG: glycosyltransferase [Nitrospirae bacterium]|nr:glycosyltransferase [Nitrospirota bacterium]
MTVPIEFGRRGGRSPLERQVYLSVVIPIHNEEESVRALYTALREVCDHLARPYEIVLVDDGSRDGTFGLMAEIHRQDPNLKVIRFRKNYGQTAAMAAGLEYARGGVIVSMDGDLQNNPADIPVFSENLTTTTTWSVDGG